MSKLIAHNHHIKELQRSVVYITLILFFLLLINVFVGISCTQTPEPLDETSSYTLPTKEGQWTLQSAHVARQPKETGLLKISNIGEFAFNSKEIITIRPDIFQRGHFSVFDVLVHIAERGDIKLEFHYDGHMDTHIIDAINDQPFWWYQVKYSGGWFESNVFRMDMYPYKDGAEIWVLPFSEERRTQICQTFADEVQRLSQNEGKVIIPSVTIGHKIFKNVRVTNHNLRTDVLQPGIITATDILLSLAEQEGFSQLKLTWYSGIGEADPIDSYFTEQIDMGDGINDSEAYHSCGWVYETGPREFHGFRGSHIHIPSDVRVIVSPEYALWFWICL